MNCQKPASDVFNRPSHRANCPFVVHPCPSPSSRLRLRERAQTAVVNSIPDNGSINAASVMSPPQENLARPDAQGRFGRFGGKYVPETLIAALTELEEEFKIAIKDSKFQVSQWDHLKAKVVCSILIAVTLARYRSLAAQYSSRGKVSDSAGGFRSSTEGLCGQTFALIPR
jgi:hypothetical protein